MGRQPEILSKAWGAVRQRLRRRALLWRAIRARRRLLPVSGTGWSPSGDEIILVGVLRDESLRLPYFLEHYRALGVDRFLLVDNGSTDDGPALLSGQPDVSLWRCEDSYRKSRFGLDWTNWLLMRYGHNRWCVTVDADELLLFSHHEKVGLRGLTAWLDKHDCPAFGALMIDLYPDGPLGQQNYRSGQSPFEILRGFDPVGYRSKRQSGLNNLWVQGGPRDRVFFSGRPQQAPTMNKLPLVKWRRSYCYVNSTHSMRPVGLNKFYDGPWGSLPRGALMHTKFLPDIAARANAERAQGEHFHNPGLFQEYYRDLQDAPALWNEQTAEFTNWRDLAKYGLISQTDWSEGPNRNSEFS